MPIYPAFVTLTIDLAVPDDRTHNSEPRGWSLPALSEFFREAMRGQEKDHSFHFKVSAECPKGRKSCGPGIHLPSLTTTSFPAGTYFFTQLFLAPKLATSSMTAVHTTPQDHFEPVTAFRPTPDNRSILTGIRQVDMLCCCVTYDYQ
jgi:hypothetical protein